MQISIYTDGGSINNPGEAASAFVIYKDKKILISRSLRIGTTTNNVAEYTALVKALEEVVKLKQSKIITEETPIFVFSDSSLMVNQLNGFFKVKNAVIREFVMKIRVLEGEIKNLILYKHVLREKNYLADSLVKKALKIS